MSVERKNYPHLANPVGPYVHAVKHAGLVFVSGITALGTPAQGQSLPKQAEAIFSQIRSIASAEGASLKALLKVTIFVTSFESIVQLRAVLFKEYGENLPASSLVQVAGLFSPEINIEIEACWRYPMSNSISQPLAH